MNTIAAFDKLIYPFLNYNPRHISCDLFEDLWAKENISPSSSLYFNSEILNNSVQIT